VLGDVIFTNWKVKDLSQERKTFDNIRNGLDFGFGADPVAFNRMHYYKKRKRLYILDEFNGHGLTNPQLAKEIKPIVGNERVVCDSAEPKSIMELRNLDAHKINAVGAMKGPDSVNFGIQWLQQQEIIIDKRCQNTINEFQSYQWKKNAAGETLRIPVDKDNHHIDGIRYAMEGDMEQRIARVIK
jgi:phage terminase large subunit